MGALYLLTFPGGRQYIGITSKTAEARFRDHCSQSKKARGRRAVHAAMLKYGPENVTIRTLLVAEDRAFLCGMEVAAIAAFGTKAPTGYNLTAGGDGFAELAAEAKAKQSAGRLGRKLSDETRAKISASAKAQMARPGAREFLRAAAKVRRLSDATKAKISASSVAALSPPEVRARISAGTRAAFRRDDVKANLRAARARTWASPEARASHAAKMRAKWADPEWKALMLASRRRAPEAGS